MNEYPFSTSTRRHGNLVMFKEKQKNMNTTPSNFCFPYLFAKFMHLGTIG